MLNTIETIYISTFFFLSSTTTKFNLLHLMFLITVVVFLSILLPFLSLYNPFSTQQPEKSFYVINWIMLLCVLNLRMKFKPLCLAYTDLQDLALASLYNLVSHWSSPPPAVLQPRCTLCFICSSNIPHSLQLDGDFLFALFWSSCDGVLLIIEISSQLPLRENVSNYLV